MDERLGLRDIAMMCENLSPDDPNHRPSTIVTLHGSAKCAQNEVELGASMARAATDERMQLLTPRGRISYDSQAIRALRELAS